MTTLNNNDDEREATPAPLAVTLDEVETAEAVEDSEDEALELEATVPLEEDGISDQLTLADSEKDLRGVEWDVSDPDANLGPETPEIVLGETTPTDFGGLTGEELAGSSDEGIPLVAAQDGKWGWKSYKRAIIGFWSMGAAALLISILGYAQVLNALNG